MIIQVNFPSIRDTGARPPRSAKRLAALRRTGSGHRGLGELRIQREPVRQGAGPLAQLGPLRLAEVAAQRLADHTADLAEVVGLEAAGGQRGRAYAQAGRHGRGRGSKGTALRLTVMPTS